MRLIATFNDEKSALAFARLLSRESIESTFESRSDPKSHQPIYCIWVQNEDFLDRALKLKEQLQKGEVPHKEAEEIEPRQAQVKQKPGKRVALPVPTPLTRLIIIICALLFLFDAYQRMNLVKKLPAYAETIGITQVDAALFYDYPEVLSKIYTFYERHPDIKVGEEGTLPPEAQKELTQLMRLPAWSGFYTHFVAPREQRGNLDAPMFEKIRQGEVWRVFTPCLLHQGFFHVLFNMLWLWLLGRQVEWRAGKWRYLVLTLIIGVISNTCQYLMSGPFFLGYSGIITGLAGYIWMRQKRAPWEEYILPRGTLLFLGIFVVGMLVFQIVLFFLQKGGSGYDHISIANTAHISGALVGMALGCIPKFGGVGCR